MRGGDGLHVGAAVRPKRCVSVRHVPCIAVRLDSGYGATPLLLLPRQPPLWAAGWGAGGFTFPGSMRSCGVGIGTFAEECEDTFFEYMSA